MKIFLRILLLPVVLIGVIVGCIYSAFIHGFNKTVEEMEKP